MSRLQSPPHDRRQKGVFVVFNHASTSSDGELLSTFSFPNEGFHCSYNGLPLFRLLLPQPIQNKSIVQKCHIFHTIFVASFVACCVAAVDAILSVVRVASVTDDDELTDACGRGLSWRLGGCDFDVAVWKGFESHNGNCFILLQSLLCRPALTPAPPPPVL